MNAYSWTSRGGIKTQLSFSTNFDNIITRFKGGRVIESAILMDCGVVYRMPGIMRYCFERNVNLMKNRFLRDLPKTDFSEINPLYVESDFKRPLKDDRGLLRSISGNLVLYSSSYFGASSSVSFNAKEVPRFVEGIIKVLDYDGVRLGQTKCIQIVQYYQQCLKRNVLK